MLKKQYSKIKENNEIVSKNNKDIKEKILIHGLKYFLIYISIKFMKLQHLFYHDPR